MSTASGVTPPATSPGAAAEPGPLAMELAQAMERFMGAFSRRVKAEIPGELLSYPRLRLLAALHQSGPRIMSDLGTDLGVTARNITALVDGLEADGYVRRRPHPSDRRATIVELTSRADVVPAQIQAHRLAAARVFGQLSKADQREFLRLMRRLEERLAKPSQ